MTVLRILLLVLAIAIAVMLLVILVRACSVTPVPDPFTIPTVVVTVTPEPTLFPSPTPSPTPTETPLPTPTPEPTETVTPTPETVPTATPLPDCQKSGEVAWRLPEEGDRVHDEITFGGTDERCWIVGQAWTNGTQPRELVFGLRPGHRASLQNLQGGMAWYLDGDETAVGENLANQARELEERRPGIPTEIIILPDSGERIPETMR